MTLMHVIILSIIEGITEFLPISSTGHLILASKLLNIPNSNFLTSFEITIQLGAIMAVVVLYWKRVGANIETWKRVISAFIPTAILGFIFYKLIKQFLLSNSTIVVWSLLIGGILLIIFELIIKKKKIPEIEINDISYKKSVAIGLAQSIAMIPGVSRSAATIIGGLLMGINRKTIVEFSFLLAVPTMAGATFLDLVKNADTFETNQIHLLMIGFVISFIVALASIKWLLYFIKNHTFILFGIYRIIAALALWFFMIKQ